MARPRKNTVDAVNTIDTVDNDELLSKIAQEGAVDDENEETNEVDEVTEVETVVPTTTNESGINVSMEQLEQLGLKNKSQIIRYLHKEGFKTAAIAKYLNIRYQHARNVIMQPLKRPQAASE